MNENFQRNENSKADLQDCMVKPSTYFKCDLIKSPWMTLDRSQKNLSQKSIKKYLFHSNPQSFMTQSKSINKKNSRPLQYFIIMVFIVKYILTTA